MKISAAFLFLATAGMATAASVTFNSVTGTYDQGAPYNVGASINGNAQDGTGWGIFSPNPGEGHTAPSQTGYYTASAPFSGTQLGISIPQLFGSDHYARDVRVSYTTDAVPGAGSTWTALNPGIARAANGLNLLSLGSNRFGPSGTSYNGGTNFMFIAHGAFSGVTGMRLELFNSGGTIGNASNGNLVISELLVTTDNSVNLALAAPVNSSAPQWPGQPDFAIVDGDTRTVSHPAQDAFAGFSYTVNLQNSFDLTSIELLNRGDGCCPDRLSNYRVEVLSPAMATLWSGNIRTDGSNSGTGGLDTITAASGTGTFSGQYIRVTNLSGSQYNPQIAELRAFGALAIPEPAAASSSVVAALGFMLRRRRQAASDGG